MTTIRSFACAVALLLASEPAAASWGRVQAIPSGTRVSVQVPNRLAAKGQRVTRGSLESVTEDSVVVRTNDSALRSIPRNRILRLKVYVPASKRGKAWAITGSLAAVSLWVFPYVAGRGTPPSDNKHGGILYLIAAAVSIPVSVVVHPRARWNTVYRPSSRSRTK